MYCFGPHRRQIFFGKTQPKGTITIAAADGEPPLNPQSPSRHFHPNTTPSFVNTHSTAGPAAGLPRPGSISPSTHLHRSVIRAGDEFENRMNHLAAFWPARNDDSGY